MKHLFWATVVLGAALIVSIGLINGLVVVDKSAGMVVSPGVNNVLISDNFIEHVTPWEASKHVFIDSKRIK